MAYQSFMPGNDEQALQNWYALAMQQQADNPDVFQQLGQANPGRNFAVSSSGSVLDFGQVTPAWRNIPQNTQLDYANPIEVAGVGKGWLAKNDPSMTVYDSSGQKIASLGNDMAAGRKLDAEKLQQTHVQLQNEKLRKEINARPEGMKPVLVDGQWVYPPSAERPGGVAYPVEGFSKKSTAAGQKEQAAQEARDRMENLLNAMEQDYKDLASMGGIVTPTNTTAQNLAARAKGSWLGQQIGGAIGTDEQVIRDKIAMTLPSILNEIRLATAMGVTQLNTQKELEFYAKAATDPSKSLEANLDALKRLRESYVAPKGTKTAEVVPTQPQPTEPQIPAGPASEQIRDNGAYVEAGGKRYIVIRRNPDGSAVIRDPQTGRTGTMRQ